MYDVPEQTTRNAIGTATEAMKNVDPEEWSYLMDIIQSSHQNLSALDISLGILAKKLKPVKINLPQKDDSNTIKSPEDSPAIMQIRALNERLHYIRQNIEALTESIQV